MPSYDGGIGAVGAKALDKVAQQITHMAHLVDNWHIWEISASYWKCDSLGKKSGSIGGKID